MKTFVGNVVTVARHELADAVRSRRAAALLLVLLGASILGCNAFISLLQRVEQQLTEALGIPSFSATGRVADSLWQSPHFRRLLISLAGEQSIAEGLLNYPPIAVFHGWMLFLYTPALILLLTSGRIAGDLSTGAVRFVLFRTTRAAWVLGKFLGQALLLILALVFTLIGAWVTIRFRVPGSGSVSVLGPLAVFTGKAWLHTLPYIGLALAVSQLTRSPHLATAFGFMAWIGMGFLWWASRAFGGDGWRRLWEIVPLLLPSGHALDLWRPGAAHLLSGITYLVTLALVYLLAGYARFAGRDL